MGNSLRCCLACVLPCGALDMIRIVHMNGYVEEIARHVTAGEFLHDHPNHVLTTPSSSNAINVPRIMILSPESELKRGSIYFLIPASSLPENKKKKKRRRMKTTPNCPDQKPSINANSCDRYLAEIMSENKTSRRDRRSGRVGVWRPHLHSISED